MVVSIQGFVLKLFVISVLSVPKLFDSYCGKLLMLYCVLLLILRIWLCLFVKVLVDLELWFC